jgi:arginine-tRNA-protein transferase
VWDVEQELMRLESNVLEDDQRDLNRMHEVRSQQARRARRGNGDPLRPLLPPLRQHLKTSLHLASSSPEKYELFRKYQADVHGQTLEQISDISGFERFLCDAPFPANADDNKVHRPVDLDAADAIPLGLYHMEWRLDGKLIALGVLDVLPRYVSSVYLVYDSAYAHMQIGKLSALREIALTKQLRRKDGMHTLQYYTMGLYIHSCVKMRYKAQYGPAQLLDPLVNKWFDFASIRRQLDIGQRYDFIHPLASRRAATPSNQTQTEEDIESDEEDLDLPTPPPPGIEEVSDLRLSSLLRCLILRHGEVSLLVVSMSVRSRRAR